MGVLGGSFPSVSFQRRENQGSSAHFVMINKTLDAVVVPSVMTFLLTLALALVLAFWKFSCR